MIGAAGFACEFSYHGFSLTFLQDQFGMYTYPELQRDMYVCYIGEPEIHSCCISLIVVMATVPETGKE